MLNLIIRRLMPELEYRSRRRALIRAGLREEQLRRLDPDKRVEALERSGLDPYDYIFLGF